MRAAKQPFRSATARDSTVQLVDAAGNLHTATATIVNGKMEVSSASVAEAKGVRYCYMSWHLSTVFNEAGIPLAPFKHSK